LRHPLSVMNPVAVGDARGLSHVADASIGAVLTSPPYLSRYDYPTIVRGLSEVYRSWLPERAGAHDAAELLPAVTKGQGSNRTEKQSEPPRSPLTRGRRYASPSGAEDPPSGSAPCQGAPRGMNAAARNESESLGEHVAPVVGECTEALRACGEHRLAETVMGYFRDIREVLRALRRVAVSGAPCWIVIGGARVKGVYVPADLVLAELAQAEGFVVESIVVARRLIESGRKLGSLHDVSPRESILMLRAHSER